MAVLIAWVLGVFTVALLVEVVVWRRRAICFREAAEDELKISTDLKAELALLRAQLAAASATTPCGRPRDAHGRYLKLPRG